MGVVKGSFIARESLFKNHKYVVALNTLSEKYQAYVVLNPEDDINQVSMTPEMSYFIDDWSYGIISFKSDDARCNNSTYYENKCQDIITQLTAKINQKGGIMEEKMMLTMPETAKITGIGLAKLKQIAREYSDFPYIKIGVKHLVIKEKLPEWFDKHKGEEL